MNDLINLNNFELLSIVASGSFSKVYKIKEKKTGQIFAAKISNKNIEEDSIKFMREVNIISSIKYPSIIKFIGFNKENFQGDPNPVIITDFMANGTLNNLISLENQIQTNFCWSNTSKLIIIYGIAAAMSHLHSKKIVHRDLKPSNILIDDYLCPKLSDFGLSKQILQQDDYFESKLIGTPLYLPPEAWTKYEYTEAGDVYAFSMIFYEIISNERPFKFCEPSEIAAKVTEGHRPAFTIQPPPAFECLIRRCWSQNPKQRPSFDQILIELKTNTEFLNDVNEKVDYENYIRYIESGAQTSIDEFTHGESTNFRKISFNQKLKQTITNIEANRQKPQSHLTLSELKKSSDIDDIYNCGLCLMSGREVPVNLNESARYIKKAADLGHPDSMTKYGWMLENGYGVSLDVTLACAYYKKAAESGHIDAMYHYGWMLLNGYGTEVNLNESTHFFKASADLGHPKSMYNYALMLQNGIGVKTDINMSLHYYKLAAEKGQLDAMNNYALLLESSFNDPSSIKTAFEFYKMAADRGHTKAIYNLGCMIVNGCIEKEKNEAAILFEKAAKKGHVESMFILASMLLNGDGIRKNRKDAILYFKMAADRGHVNSMHNYALLMKKSANFEEALKYFKMAADKDNPESMYNYALMVEKGDGGYNDKKVASFYYKKAADKGHHNAEKAYEALNNSGICLIN